MDDSSALRPAMPADPAEQERWFRERQIEAMLRLSTAAEQLTAVVIELRQVVAVLVAREVAP